MTGSRQLPYVPAYPGTAPQLPAAPPRRRRSKLAIFYVAAAVWSVVLAVTVAISLYIDGRAAHHAVRFEVDGGGFAAPVEITYGAAGLGSVTQAVPRLPWVHDTEVPDGTNGITLRVAPIEGFDASGITCRIFVEGELHEEVSSKGMARTYCSVLARSRF